MIPASARLKRIISRGSGPHINELVMRTTIHRTPQQNLTLVIGNERVVFEACTELARTGSVLANIHEYLLQTPERRIIKVTIVADEDQEYSRSVLKGWYV